jgi:S-DNA-T family DNA segregation ATPase FtsK/SpoIIIE
MQQIDSNAQKLSKNEKKDFDGESLDDEGGNLDPKFYQALDLATSLGSISSSLLQRKLGLGFQRAARIIDQMEELGYVGESNGSKPREVLISKEEFMELRMRNEDSD